MLGPRYLVMKISLGIKAGPVAMKYARHLVAAGLALVTVAVIGYLSIQAEGTTKGYLFDLSGAPTLSVAKRFSWEIQIGAVLFGFAAAAAYRKVATTSAVRGVVFAVLVVAAIISGASFETIHTVRTNLVVISFVMGGASFFTMALIACVLADLIFRSREGSDESTKKTRMTTEV